MTTKWKTIVGLFLGSSLLLTGGTSRNPASAAEEGPALNAPAAEAAPDLPAPPKAGEAPPVQPGAAEGDAEVMLRGPLHEAFATQINMNAEPGAVVQKQPPKAVEEVAPDQRPEGDNVQWIPGYWAWDDAGSDFIWVSGVWRDAPPNRRWVPGYWAEADGGWRWVSGSWVEAVAKVIEYLPPPEASLERGPTSEPPSADYVWAPGCWVYRGAGYVWRPGYWMVGQPNWCWIPDHYVWTPSGVVFVPGYWDYELDERGLAFCPVRFHGPYYLRPGYYYRPSVVIDTGLLTVHLWVGPRHHHYYFGDYYHATWGHHGICAWHEIHTHHHHYDPLLAHYRWDSGRRGVDVVARLQGWHDYYRQKPDMRPPHTLSMQQLNLAHSGPAKELAKRPPVLGTPLQQAAALSAGSGKNLVRMNADDHKRVSGFTSSMNNLAQERRGSELSAVKKGGALPGTKVADSARAAGTKPLKLGLPETPKTFAGVANTGSTQQAGSKPGPEVRRSRTPPSLPSAGGASLVETGKKPQGRTGDITSGQGPGKSRATLSTGPSGDTGLGKPTNTTTLPAGPGASRVRGGRSMQTPPDSPRTIDAGKPNTGIKLPSGGQGTPRGSGKTTLSPPTGAGQPDAGSRVILPRSSSGNPPSVGSGGRGGGPDVNVKRPSSDPPRGRGRSGDGDRKDKDKKPGR